MLFRIPSETELLSAFRPFERGEVELPEDLGGFPQLVRNALTWVSPSGHRAYVVFARETGAAPVGIVFRRTSGETPAALCDWCRSVKGTALGGSGHVSLLTATVSDKRRVGTLLCSDLSCLKNEDANPEAILKRMDEFARRNLF
jgi:hypothetical protein